MNRTLTVHSAVSLAPFLRASEYIDFSHPAVVSLAADLAAGEETKEAIVKSCFEYVRDAIAHTGDAGCGVSTIKASEVLEQKTGWCYAKSHLLAALLRANGIPAALCYQRLSCSEYTPGIYCLHGLNAVWLEAYGWYRIDARGNREGIDAQFTPPVERLAFALGENDYDIEGRFAEPLPEVIDALQTYKRYEEMIGHFPDIRQRDGSGD
ncbi:transglutaminase family protein [Sulfurimonas sp. HSL1-2]|uniref:transglutaminase-like domain-containing protein n=1 Tax=Thiomicrolovo zhangzhouensis TaxID=3131933 RepID=UPI0031F80F98